MKAPEANATDGRVLRGERSHTRIVQALYELIREGHVDPTADQVAERAGVGTRTVFRQFEDLESLYRSLGERVQAEVLAQIDIAPPTGRLIDDLTAAIERRRRIFEHVAPFRRASRRVAHSSPFLKAQELTLAKALRIGLLAILGPHLPDDAEDVIEALDLVMSFEAWDRLRVEQKLSVKRAERVIFHSATTLAKAAIKPKTAARARSTS